MIFSRDLSGYSVAVIKELPMGTGITVVNGALLQSPATADQMYCTLQATTWIDTIGLYWDVGTVTTGAVESGTLQYKKVVINPHAVFMAEYENNTTNNLTSVTYSDHTWSKSTSETAVGDWFYHTDSLAAAGLLMYIGSKSTTSNFTSVATPTAATPPASGNILMHIHGCMKGPAAGTYERIDLTADAAQIDTATAYTGVGLVVIDSYYSGRSGGLESLRFANHDDTVDTKARFFSEITAVDHALNKI